MRAIGSHALDAGAALRPKTNVWYGTNEYNFEKLPDPPAYEPTKYSHFATVISPSEDEYSYERDKFRSSNHILIVVNVIIVLVFGYVLINCGDYSFIEASLAAGGLCLFLLLKSRR
jgi:hypothetical protein